MNADTVVASMIGVAFALGLFIAFVMWASARLNRRRPAPSKPYTDKYAQDANHWPVDDFRAARAADPAVPPLTRRIPNQRKELS
jgi:hypothetical protein